MMYDEASAKDAHGVSGEQYSDKAPFRITIQATLLGGG
jgi:hypothetical protein